MAQTGAKAEKHGVLATRDDVVDSLGHLDDGKMVAIMALKPTVAEMEEASVWLSGDADVFGPGRALKDISAKVVAILTEDEEEDASRAR